MADSEWKRHADKVLAASEQAINSHREIIRLLKGETESPGVLERLNNVESVMRGGSDGKEIGLVMKVTIMWWLGRVAISLLFIVAGAVFGRPILEKLAILIK